MDQHTVDAFYFEDISEGKKAGREMETIHYIRMKTDLSKTESVWLLYQKLLDNRMFETPAGISFLYELYTILIQSGKYSEEAIPKIYIESPDAGIADKTAKKTTVPISDNTAVNPPEDTEEKKNQKNDGQEEKSLKEEPDDSLYSEEEIRIRDEVKRRTQSLYESGERRVQGIRDGYAVKSRNLRVVITALVLVIIGLLVMTYFSDSSPLLDAETRIQDQYSAWEESLTAKEQELNEKEKDLELRENQLESQETQN